MKILTKNLNPVTEYRLGNSTYIEARENSVFYIKLENNTSEEILAVVSVDGTNVISGSPASYTGRGYVLRPGENQIIRGWRLDNSLEKEFKFSSLNNSYNAKTHQGTNNCGVIAVAYFKKKIEFPKWTNSIYYSEPKDYWTRNQFNPWSDTTRSYNAYSSPTGSSTVSSTVYLNHNTTKGSETSLGVGTGEKITSTVSNTKFDRCDSPYYVKTIQYKTEKQLRALGIIVAKAKPRQPNPFPGNYCQDV